MCMFSGMFIIAMPPPEAISEYATGCVFQLLITF